jgi:hypothetical protein
MDYPEIILGSVFLEFKSREWKKYILLTDIDQILGEAPKLRLRVPSFPLKKTK